jgi:large repetitive protein
VTVTTGETTLTSNQEFLITPQLLSFNPPGGPAGTQVTIIGTGLTQTLGVAFGDNVPAEFTVNSDTEITATVPTGGETGPIGVVTKGGTAVSSEMFTVN